MAPGDGCGPEHQLRTRLYRAGSWLARHLPDPVAQRLPQVAGWPLAAAMRGARRQLERHLVRAGAGAAQRDLRRASRRAIASYVRYWVESFRLVDRTPEELAAGITVDGYEHVEAGLDAGNGVILALPHLGGWEWAGFWMATVNRVPMTVVVEAIEPDELFEWFRSFRTDLGMNVIGLGPDAGTEVARALGRNEVVCLLSDRDIVGGGIEVEFFGETTTLPGGPALLGVRTGAAVLPTAVYFTGGGGHLGVVRPALDTSRHGRVREDVARVTRDLAAELELLIARDPEQWHLLQPNWPSDRLDA